MANILHIHRAPTSNVLNRLLWLGCLDETSKLISAGSAVALDWKGTEYIATALHVLKDTEANLHVRGIDAWFPVEWQIVATDEPNDIAVLKVSIPVAPNLTVKYGEGGMVYGTVGYVLGFPSWLEKDEIRTDHIIKSPDGRPTPMAAVVVANFGGSLTYSAAYVNAGFSGGAVVFPVENDWTIAGIITHFPTVRRPVFREGVETGYYVKQHTGLVGYASTKLVFDLIG